MISTARVAFAAAVMEVGEGGSNHPDSSTAKAAGYYTILTMVASGTDQSLQELWHWTEAQALILERYAAKPIGGPELQPSPRPYCPPSTPSPSALSTLPDRSAPSNTACPSFSKH